MAITEEVEASLLSADGETLCRFLREVFYAQESQGSAAAEADCPGGPSMVRLACRLSLLKEVGRGRWQLTPDGYALGSVAKEYCNWIDEGRQLPKGVTEAMLGGKRVLDVGCSFGRHLIAFSRCGATGYGLEPQPHFLELSRVLAAREKVPAPKIVQGCAEDLPFEDGQFDIVFCRLVLNYVLAVSRTLRESARVLVPGGRLILIYVPFNGLVRSLLHNRWIGNRRAAAWDLFAAVNTLVLQTTGRQIRLSCPGRLYGVHSPTFPTVRWMRAALSKVGFSLSPSNPQDEKEGLFQAIRRPGPRERQEEHGIRQDVHLLGCSPRH